MSSCVRKPTPLPRTEAPVNELDDFIQFCELHDERSSSRQSLPRRRSAVVRLSEEWSQWLNRSIDRCDLRSGAANPVCKTPTTCDLRLVPTLAAVCCSLLHSKGKKRATSLLERPQRSQILGLVRRSSYGTLPRASWRRTPDYGNVATMPFTTTARLTPRVASGSVGARRTVRRCSM